MYSRYIQFSLNIEVLEKVQVLGRYMDIIRGLILVGGKDPVDYRDIAILTSGKYSFPVPESKFVPFLGAGLGLHLFKHEVDLPFFGKQSDTDTKFGFHLLGGSEMELSPMIDGFAELRYCLVSDINQLWIFAGIKYKLGVR